jgi:hypothetical protein
MSSASEDTFYNVSNDLAGLNGQPLRWSVQLTSILNQGFQDNSTRQDDLYNGIDVSPGHFIANLTGEKIFKIVSISEKTETTVTCIVEDSEMLTYRLTGSNNPASVPDYVLFSTNAENEPLIVETQFSDGTLFSTDAISAIETRFRLTEFDDRAKFSHAVAPTVQVGDVVSVDASGNLVKAHSVGANAIPVGTVFEILRGGLDVYVKPFNDIINQHENPEEIDGNIGDIYYTDSSNPGKVTTTKDGSAVYLQLSDSVPTSVTATSSNLPTATDAVIINGATVFDGPGGDSVATITDWVNLLNTFTSTTKVSASEFAASIVAESGDAAFSYTGGQAAGNDVGIFVLAAPWPEFTISDGTNTDTVTFDNTYVDSTAYGYDLISPTNILQAILDQATTVNITASTFSILNGLGIRIEADSLVSSLTFTTVQADAFSQSIQGCLGINSSYSQGSAYLRLTRFSGGEIDIQGSPVQGGYINSNGIVSSGLGTPPRLLLTDDDLDQVPNVTSSDGDATGVFISHTPFGDGLVQVTVNGLASNLGDGVTTSSCYFSVDGGTTARAMADIEGGDQLYWNGSIAGYELDGTDLVDVIYDKPSV